MIKQTRHARRALELEDLVLRKPDTSSDMIIILGCDDGKAGKVQTSQNLDEISGGHRYLQKVSTDPSPVLQIATLVLRVRR